MALHALLIQSARISALAAGCWACGAIPRSLATCAVFARPAAVDISSDAHGISLLPAVSQRAATARVSAWLVSAGQPAPDARSLQDVLQHSSDDMVRIVGEWERLHPCRATACVRSRAHAASTFLARACRPAWSCPAGTPAALSW